MGLFDWLFGKKEVKATPQPTVTVGMDSDAWLDWMLDSAGRGLTTPDWKRLLEEIGADIDGHLDALNDEAETAEGETL